MGRRVLESPGDLLREAGAGVTGGPPTPPSPVPLQPLTFSPGIYRFEKCLNNPGLGDPSLNMSPPWTSFTGIKVAGE